MPTGEPISRDWIDRVRAHDEKASREMVEQLLPLVRRIVLAHRPWRMSEEDLCQEVFMKLFSSLEQYRGTAPFEHWVARMTVNTCITQLRRQRCRPELRWADLDPNQARALAPLGEAVESATVDSVTLRELLGQLLDTLPPEDRLVIQLTAIEERAVKEVAVLTGWSVTAVKVRAFRARQRMRRALERLLASEKS